MTTSEAVQAHVFDMVRYSNRIFRTSFPEQCELRGRCCGGTAEGAERFAGINSATTRRRPPLPAALRIEAERPR
jgi:hypothetical protein